MTRSVPRTADTGSGVGVGAGAGPARGSEKAVTRLRERLAADAERDGLLDVAYATTDSPVGQLLLAATERGLLRIAFEVQGFDEALDAIAERVSPRVLRSPARLDEARRQLDEYFERTRRGFDLPLDHALSRGFRLRVQEFLPDIPYGEHRSYREVAEAVGSPRAVRAVGTACATNPLPLVVPCHRVLRSDGSAGAYAGGAETKLALLGLEGA